MATVATRQKKSSFYEEQERIPLTPTGLLMEGNMGEQTAQACANA
jgi:hypothetical protein